MSKIIRDTSALRIFEAFRDSFNAHLKKSQDSEELVDCVESVLEGYVAAIPLMHEHCSKLIDVDLETFAKNLVLFVPGVVKNSHLPKPDLGEDHDEEA